MERIPWMHNLTPEQIGIDYDAIARIIAMGAAHSEIGLDRLITNLGGIEAILEAAVSLYGVTQIREWLDRVEAEKRKSGEPTLSDVCQCMRHIIELP